MENIRDFMNELSGEIMNMLPKDLTKDLSIDQATVTKMNDQVLYGLTFKRREVDAAPAAMVWKYIGELVFNMLVLVGTVKMSDRVVREMMGL